MKRQVTRTVILATALLLMAAISPGTAQETTAEVRTWSGQTVVLAGPWVELFYTAMPKPAEGEAAPGAPGAAPAPPTGGGGPQAEIRGSVQSLQHAFEEGPQPVRAQRETSVLTFSRAGVERKVPLERLATLIIARQPVAGSSLPPYISPTHQRYAATAILTDGSRIDADYLNFGTAVLHGMTSQGRVDVPFDEIESVRFSR
jgi:hypothetical protein